MTNCSISLFLLIALAAGAIGCSSNNYPASRSNQGLRTRLLLLPTAHKDADDIGSLGPEAAAQPADLDEYRRPATAVSYRQAVISRHPFR